ncbi:MAG TPA: prolyl oligopeptidase family serine peptidase [Vicinamibacterales bacterium]|jgi:predicted esterase|nr:prolyl oligopeptidase family serine peptidase [Vicinamibacterales bacterium]
MRLRSTASSRVLCVAVSAFCFQLILTNARVVTGQEPARQPAPASPPNAPVQGRGRGPIPVDPRVQIRMHHFAETNEEIPYALFVSSKVDPKKKAPMIVTLHGLGGTHTTMMRPVALDLAEAGGYILVAPMGYNPRGWYGIPRGPRRGGPPPNAASNAAPTDAAGATQPRRGGPPPGALNGANDPPNVRELSEKDTLEVVDLVRKEFKVDEKRTYLMGHSMGGAGTYYLAVKYPDRWAAIAVLAPAAFGLDPNSLATIPKTPVMVVHGDMDTAVPVSLSRNWVEVMKSLKIPHQYIEVAGGDHGSVITSHQSDLFAFFAKHKR